MIRSNIKSQFREAEQILMKILESLISNAILKKQQKLLEEDKKMPVDLQDESYESDYYFPTAGMARRQERKFKRTEDKEREDVVRRRIGYIGEIGGAFQGAREKAQMDRMLQNSLQQPSSQQPSSQM